MAALCNVRLRQTRPAIPNILSLSYLPSQGLLKPSLCVFAAVEIGDHGDVRTKQGVGVIEV